MAMTLVKEKLAACVNMISNLVSVYNWQGKLKQAKEVLLVIKNKKELFEKIANRVKHLHTYEVPEIIALPIVKGFKPYLEWLENETS